MIIFDGSQLLISNIVNEDFSVSSFDIGYSRHITLNSIRKYVLKYKATYGNEVVIACDSKNYWRTEIFPYYKFKRIKTKKESSVDWESLYKCADQLIEEFNLYTPFKVVQVDGCEGDDIIGVLARRAAPSEKVMILSSDKDFGQLQVHPNVHQFATAQKKVIKIKNPAAHLKEMIIRGDTDDSIPNILSPDDTFFSGGRQKSVMTTKLNVWMNQKPEDFCNQDMLRNYYRNKALIDFNEIPSKICSSIIDAYDNAIVKTRSEFLSYMINCRLKNLICDIGDF